MNVKKLLLAGLISIFLIPAGRLMAAADGPVSWWKLDEGSGTVVKDSAGVNNGSINLATWVNGKYGAALSFDGKDGYIAVPDAANLNPAQITMEMWVKFNKIPSTGVALNKEGQYRLAAADVDGTCLSIRYATEATTWGSGTLRGATPLVSGVWYHAAATYDGAQWKIYLNGKKDGEKAEHGALKPNVVGVMFIGAVGGKNFTFDGLIQQVKIWNRALSADEIKASYEALKGTHGSWIDDPSLNPGSQEGAQELLPNNSFEELTAAGSPNGWKRFVDDHLSIDNEDIKQYGNPSNSIVSQDAHSGKNAILIDIPEGAKEIGGWSTRVAMKPKTTYVLTFWAKAQGKPSAGVKVEGYGADGVRKDIVYPTIEYSDAWKEYRFEFESKPEITGALVTIFNWQSSGKFWLDDVSLKEFSFTGGQSDEAEVKKGETPLLYLTREVVTPHITWALPWAEGPVRVLAIPPDREVVELAQRLEMGFTSWQKSIPQFMDMIDRICYNPPDRDVMYFAKSFFQKINQSLDVILVGKYDLSTIVPVLQSALLKKVEGGAGLIVIRPKSIDWLSPALQNPISNPDFVLSGVPFDGLPALGGEAKGDKWLKCYSYGKGRVAIVNYYNENLGFNAASRDYWSGMNLPFTPETSYDFSSKPLYYDYYQGWLAKLVLWAGQKEGSLSISKLSAGSGQASLVLKSPKSIKDASVEIVVRDTDGTIEAKENKPLSITQGETSFTQSLPPLKSGKHFADLWIRDAAGKVLNWGSASFTTTSPITIVSVKTSKFSYPPTQAVEGIITTDQALSPEMTLRFQLRDTLGRLIAEKKVKGANQKEVAFSFLLTGTVAIIHEVVADLLDGNNRVISQGKTEFMVKKEVNPSDDYRIYSWGGKDGNNGTEAYLLKDMYERGLDVDYMTFIIGDIAADPYREALLTAARQNLTIMSYTTGHIANGTDGSANDMDPNRTVRGRPLEGKEFRDTLSRELLKKATVSRDFPMAAYSLGDEIGVSAFAQDYDFSPSGLAFIRNYLKSQYGDIAKLNAEWGKNYTSFEEVTPMTLKEARAYGNPAPWIDLRVAMEAMWASIIRFSVDTIQKVDPGARVGGEGMGTANTMANGEDSWNGYDFGQVIPEGGMWGCYFNNYPDMEFLRSFAASGSALWTFTNPFGDYPGGYFSDYYHVEKNDRFVPWYDLFNGINGTTFWDSRATEWWGWYSRDLRLMPWGENIFSTVQELKSGVGKMLLKSVRQNNGIAIYYSPVSFHVETYLDGKERKESPRAFCALLEDLGLQYDFLSKEQMAQGKLSNYKFLILPYTRALSPEEAKGMREFVAKGGTIFSDGPAGIMNEHGTKVAVNLLSGVALTTAANPIWKYMSVRDTQAGIPYRQEVKDALAKAGIKPRFQITPKDGGELTGCEVVEWQDGKATYLGLLQGREYIKKKEQDTARPVIIALPGKYHVYSVREKKYLGYTNAIDTTIESATAKVYALLPEKIERLQVKGLADTYRPGQQVQCTIQVASTTPHVYHVAVIKPDGQTHREYTRNVYAAAGQPAAASFPLALNDQPGKWKVVVSDTATGVKTETAFTIKGAAN